MRCFFKAYYSPMFFSIYYFYFILSAQIVSFFFIYILCHTRLFDFTLTFYFTMFLLLHGMEYTQYLVML